MKIYIKVLVILFGVLVASCQEKVKPSLPDYTQEGPTCSTISKASMLGVNDLNPTFLKDIDSIAINPEKAQDFRGMVKIPAGVFEMGGDTPSGFNQMPKTALPQGDEFPKHSVKIDAFYMDTHEVTNAQFKEFVDATGYVTIAERPIIWDEIKNQYPPGTPKPSEEDLQPGSLVFSYAPQGASRDNLGNWWTFKKNTNWRQPQGEGSSIVGKENHPVVHVSWYDALVYAKWAGKRLPTEAEYEYAMRGGKQNQMYPWGNTKTTESTQLVNHLQGEFPYTNTIADGFERTAPIQSFPANNYGLYDIAGNVWEWTNDWYSAKYYYELSQAGGVADNPQGPIEAFEVYETPEKKKVLRGGSFLCNDTWCSGFRNSRRMRNTPDTSMEHIGFRCVRDAN